MRVDHILNEWHQIFWQNVWSWSLTTRQNIHETWHGIVAKYRHSVVEWKKKKVEIWKKIRNFSNKTQGKQWNILVCKIFEFPNKKKRLKTVLTASRIPWIACHPPNQSASIVCNCTMAFANRMADYRSSVRRQNHLWPLMCLGTHQMQLINAIVFAPMKLMVMVCHTENGICDGGEEIKIHWYSVRWGRMRSLI